MFVASAFPDAHEIGCWDENRLVWLLASRSTRDSFKLLYTFVDLIQEETFLIIRLEIPEA